MIVSVSEARGILGKAGQEYTDEQVEEVINLFVAISDLAIDSYLEKKRRLKEVKANATAQIDFERPPTVVGKKGNE